MAVLGLSTRFAASGRPVVSCVLLDGSQATPQRVDGWELKTSESEIIAQIDDLGRKISSALSALTVEAVVIRIADTAPSANRKSGPRHRLQLEGAFAYVCREHKVPQVVFRNGKDCGEMLGISKAEALTLGEKIDSKFAEPAAAALTALPPGTATTIRTR